MNLSLQNKIIGITDNGDFMVSVIAWVLEEEGAIPFRLFGRNPQKEIQDAIQRYERIDGLVNTLAPSVPGSLENGTYEAFVGSLRTNVISPYLITQAAKPWLEKSKGAIVNLISRTATTGQGSSSGYAAASGGRIGLTAAWAEELAAQNIRVNGIVLPEGVAPLEQRTSTYKEIGHTIAYLLSDAAAGLRGELVYVDSGYVHLAREIDGTT